MRRHVVVLVGLVSLLSLAAGRQPVPDRPPVDPAAPVGADGFTIHLEPEFALENGPVVYRIRLTNRTAEPRDCFRHTHDRPVRFTRTPDWNRKPTPDSRRMLISGRFGPYREQVAGGKSTTDLVAVQNWYQRIPPGRVTVEFEWDVVGPEGGSWNVPKRSWGVNFIDISRWPRVPVRGRQTFEVQPATPENVTRIKEKLERYLHEAVGGTRPIREVVQCLTGIRHPEFVPLMIRAVQRCEDYECRDLLDTVYDSFPDPTTGFERLFPLLEAGDPATRYLLDYWDHEAFRHLVYRRQLASLADRKAGRREVDGGPDRNPYASVSLENDLQVWNYSRPHNNSRLTLGQHARIQAVGNVWVRAAYWIHFPDLCSPDWVLCLYADLRRTILPPDARVVAAICRGLTHDRYTVRERATADAMKLDERVVPALRDHLKRHPSGELEQRISSIAQHFEQQPIPSLAAHVIQTAMYGGQLQGELIFEALSGPVGSCRLADSVREKRPEQQKRRQEELARKREAARLQQAR